MLFIVCCGVGNECLSALCIGSGNYRVCVCVCGRPFIILAWMVDRCVPMRRWAINARPTACAFTCNDAIQKRFMTPFSTQYSGRRIKHVIPAVAMFDDKWLLICVHCTFFCFVCFFFFIWSRLLNIMRRRLDIVKNPIVLIFVLWIKSHSTQYTVGWLCLRFFIFIAQTKWSEILKSFVRERLTHLIASNCSVVIFSVLMRLKNWFR